MKTNLLVLLLTIVSLTACEPEEIKEDTSAQTTDTVSILARPAQVVKNDASFLNGIYNVVCTCTCAMIGSTNPTVTTANYIAAVSPSSNNSCFNLDKLNVGPEDVVPLTFLRGRNIDVSFNISPVDFNQDHPASGTLSATKNTFTIETKVQKWAPAIIYLCKNVYTNSRTEKEFKK